VGHIGTGNENTDVINERKLTGTGFAGGGAKVRSRYSWTCRRAPADPPAGQSPC
jgi:hypothetical protein